MVNGISCGSINLPITPFCPCLDANLSPSSGIRFVRNVNRTINPESRLSVTYTLSTKPFSPCRTVIDDSLLSGAAKKAPPAFSSRKRGGLVFPTRTSPLSRYSSGIGKPSSSRCSYNSIGFKPFTSWFGSFPGI